MIVFITVDSTVPYDITSMVEWIRTKDRPVDLTS